MKKPKLEPIIITSREALEAVVSDVVALKLDHAQKTAAMEKEIAEIQKKHQEALLATARQIEARESGIYVYCQKNRTALFTDKKSLDLLLAVIGFETTPHRVEKANSKDTFGKIAQRLEQAGDWAADYIRYPDAELNKENLLRDRSKLTPEQLQLAGIRFEQDENFFIRPKSQVAEQSIKEAA